VQADLSNKNTSLGTKQNDLQKARENVASTSGNQTKELMGQLNSAQAQFNDAQKKADQLETALKKLKNEEEDFKARLTHEEKGHHEATAEVEKLNNEIKAAKARVDELNKKKGRSSKEFIHFAKSN